MRDSEGSREADLPRRRPVIAASYAGRCPESRPERPPETSRPARIRPRTRSCKAISSSILLTEMIMTNATTKPICLLGRPCLDAECAFCDPSRLLAAAKSARSAFFPSRRERRVLIAMPYWTGRGLDSSALPSNLSKACEIPTLQRARILAGMCLLHRPKGYDGYFVGWVFILDVPRDVPMASVGRELKNACTALMGKRQFSWSFGEALSRRDLNTPSLALFTWHRELVEDCRTSSPPGDRAAIDVLLNSVRSSERIYSQNLDRGADGLFLPSPYRPAKSPHSHPRARGRANSNVTLS